MMVVMRKNSESHFADVDNNNMSHVVGYLMKKFKQSFGNCLIWDLSRHFTEEGSLDE